MRLAAEADCNWSTVERYLTGAGVQPNTCRRIEKAAARLGLTLPPRPASPKTEVRGPSKRTLAARARIDRLEKAVQALTAPTKEPPSAAEVEDMFDTPGGRSE